MMARLYWHLTPHQLKNEKKKTKKKRQSWTPSDKNYLDPRMFPMSVTQYNFHMDIHFVSSILKVLTKCIYVNVS